MGSFNVTVRSCNELQQQSRSAVELAAEELGVMVTVPIREG